LNFCDNKRQDHNEKHQLGVTGSHEMTHDCCEEYSRNADVVCGCTIILKDIKVKVGSVIEIFLSFYNFFATTITLKSSLEVRDFQGVC
jgi:hypothetical protein